MIPIGVRKEALNPRGIFNLPLFGKQAHKAAMKDTMTLRASMK